MRSTNAMVTLLLIANNVLQTALRTVPSATAVAYGYGEGKTVLAVIHDPEDFFAALSSAVEVEGLPAGFQLARPAVPGEQITTLQRLEQMAIQLNQ